MSIESLIETMQRNAHERDQRIARAQRARDEQRARDAHRDAYEREQRDAYNAYERNA